MPYHHRCSHPGWLPLCPRTSVPSPTSPCASSSKRRRRLGEGPVLPSVTDDGQRPCSLRSLRRSSRAVAEPPFSLSFVPHPAAVRRATSEGRRHRGSATEPPPPTASLPLLRVTHRRAGPQEGLFDKG
jgi:hypothetical protein